MSVHSGVHKSELVCLQCGILIPGCHLLGTTWSEGRICFLFVVWGLIPQCHLLATAFITRGKLVAGVSGRWLYGSLLNNGSLMPETIVALLMRSAATSRSVQQCY